MSMVVDWDWQRHRHGSCCLYIIVFIFFCVTMLPTSTTADDTMVITEADLEALMAIKQSLVDPLGALRTWNSSSSLGACQNKWEGVKCAQGQVIVLQLANKGLGGTLSPQVGQLPALRKLNLHHNRIQGSIPSTISFLTNLRGLYLNHNLFTGFIPAGITSSTMLQSIDLSYNMLSGSIPALAVPTLPSPKLFYLDFSYNNLSGSIPANVFASFTSLRELHLRHNHLQGPIPAAQFEKFASLAVLDLSDNQFSGPFPEELTLSSSSNFSVLDVSFNQLSGELPSSFGNLTKLTVLDLSHNNFTSSLPPQLANITTLQKLDISVNKFNGTLPSSLTELKNLTFFNCSYNQLTGAVPKFVHSFNSSSYLGNIGLCGYNSSVACAFRAPPNQVVSSSPSSLPNLVSPSAKKRKFSSVTFIIIVVGSIVAGLLMLCLLVAVICVMCRKKASDETYGAKAVAGKGMDKSSSQSSAGGKDGMEVGGGKLVHFDGTFTFTADGLLCATAEVLGKSTYGTVYKATFEDGNQVAVKRLREGIVKSQRDFEVEVNLLGKVRHPNLLALRGYYWGPKDEKLLIYDFMAGGSLAAFLHARGPETPLNWHTRLSIAAGAARGLFHLHSNERIIHGNLTSSNILLDSRMNAKLSDFGLSRLMTTAANANVIATASALGYRAPELTKLRKASTKSDVYSFGIVLLELLTGKSPGDAASADSTAGMDLPEWVASIVKEEWTNEIFDLELMKGSAPSEDELINTLQLAMNCVTPNAGSRPTMEEVSRQLDEILNKPEQPSRHTTSSESSAPQ